MIKKSQKYKIIGKDEIPLLQSYINKSAEILELISETIGFLVKQINHGVTRSMHGVTLLFQFVKRKHSVILSVNSVKLCG